jgi:hypothetical protein
VTASSAGRVPRARRPDPLGALMVGRSALVDVRPFRLGLASRSPA